MGSGLGDYKVAWLCTDRGMCGNYVKYGILFVERCVYHNYLRIGTNKLEQTE